MATLPRGKLCVFLSSIKTGVLLVCPLFASLSKFTQLGALAFLYHPCANPDQVASLKKLADSCLWQHVITPYPDLPEETPLAIVSWGCVYSMQWVNPPEAKLWIITHALKTNSSVASSNGPYQEGEIVTGRRQFMIIVMHAH